MPSNDVDEYLDNQLPAQHRGIVNILRDLMREQAPRSEEVISRGSPAWKANKILAILSVSKTHITLAFARGAEFTDRHNLLDGVGKTTRHVKIKDAAGIDRDALRDYIQQAITLDQA